jgi:hypothetical protein
MLDKSVGISKQKCQNTKKQAKAQDIASLGICLPRRGCTAHDSQLRVRWRITTPDLFPKWEVPAQALTAKAVKGAVKCQQTQEALRGSHI